MDTRTLNSCDVGATVPIRVSVPRRSSTACTSQTVQVTVSLFCKLEDELSPTYRAINPTASLYNAYTLSLVSAQRYLVHSARSCASRSARAARLTSAASAAFSSSRAFVLFKSSASAALDLRLAASNAARTLAPRSMCIMTSQKKSTSSLYLTTPSPSTSTHRIDIDIATRMGGVILLCLTCESLTKHDVISRIAHTEITLEKETYQRK